MYRRFKLFGEKWSIGGIKQNKDGLFHSVIYGPNRKQYHVFNTDALNLRIGNNFRERADIEKTKIYILTKIIDKNNSWKFSTSIIPKVGSRVKVIYQGITIKWLTFSGSWDDHKLMYSSKSPFPGDRGSIVWKDIDLSKEIIAWRLE